MYTYKYINIFFLDRVMKENQEKKDRYGIVRGHLWADQTAFHRLKVFCVTWKLTFKY